MQSAIWKWTVALVAVCFAGLLPEATASERQWGRFDSVHIDQDLFAPGNEDRNYTMGLRFVWSGDDARHQTLNSFGLLHRIDGGLGFDYGIDSSIARAVAFGNSAFTPDDLRAVDPVRDDRPYASLLYAASSVVVKDSESAARGSKLVVGLLGLPISEWVQTKIHVANRWAARSDTPYDPQGWDNQISDGGELTAMYQRSWYRRIATASEHVDAAGSCDLSVGYYTGASCGVVGKWGRFAKSDDFWSTIDDIAPQSDANQLARMQLASDDDPWVREWYLLAGIRARAVGYNQLLQGGLRHSEHELDGGEIERLVYEVSVGANLTFRSTRRLLLTCTRRSPEHRLGQRRSHQWCGINYFRPLR